MRLRIIHVRSPDRPDLPVRRSLSGAEVVPVAVDRFVCHVEADEAAVLVVDVDLRAADAVLAVRAGMSRSRTVPAVFVTDRGQRAEETQALALGAHRVVTRPLDALTLELAIRGVLSPGVVAWLDRTGRRDDDTASTAFSAAGRAAAEMLEGMRAGRPPTPAAVGEWTALVEEDVQSAGLDAWITAIRATYTGTVQHALMVAGLATRFADNLGLPPAERRVLVAAALMHDVGAARIPPELYDRLDRLTDAEFALVRKHPALGADHLATAGLDPRIVAAVRHHHEYLDGSGYPAGLSGAEVPSIARLVTICDVFATLVAQRSYRLPTAPDAAFHHLCRMAEAGKLDGALVAAFRSTSGELSTPRHAVSGERAGRAPLLPAAS